MTKTRLVHLKNEMFLANFLANFIGVIGVEALMKAAGDVPAVEIWSYPVPYWIDMLFTPFAFLFVSTMTLVYEIPVRRYLNSIFKGAIAPRELESVARQRLLNEPFVLIALDFSMWFLAAVVYAIIHWAYGSGSSMVLGSFYHNLSIGVITVTIAFFLLEHILQKS